MNTEKISKAPATAAGEDQPRKLEFVDEIMSLGTPIGTWGGSKDIVLRIRELQPGAASGEEITASLLGPFGSSTDVLLRRRNAKRVTANVGSQGGGQN